jgi:hypothetical protein
MTRQSRKKWMEERSVSGQGASTMNQVFAHITKNKRERLRVELQEYRGHHLLSVRIWFLDPIGRLLPSHKGLSISLRHLPAVRQAIEEAEEVAQRNGLIPDEVTLAEGTNGRREGLYARGS